MFDSILFMAGAGFILGLLALLVNLGYDRNDWIGGVMMVVCGFGAVGLAIYCGLGMHSSNGEYGPLIAICVLSVVTSLFLGSILRLRRRAPRAY